MSRLISLIDSKVVFGAIQDLNTYIGLLLYWDANRKSHLP